jgi:peptidyl-tRNA hydrolase, PTH1 family
MNESGKAVKKLVDFYKVEMDDLYVIHDDLDIKLGEYKIQKGVGPKVHGGVNSIERELGKEDFWRARVGVDNRDLENRIPGEEYVLQNFTREERNILMESINQLVSNLEESIKS